MKIFIEQLIKTHSNSNVNKHTFRQPVILSEENDIQWFYLDITIKKRATDGRPQFADKVSSK